jgi:hypothetical protein
MFWLQKLLITIFKYWVIPSLSRELSHTEPARKEFIAQSLKIPL